MIYYNKPLNGYEIIYYAKELKIPDFKIYYPKQKITTRSGIINLSVKGSHYVCFYDNYYFDSFCAHIPTWIKNQLLKKYEYMETYISSYPIQKVTQSNCGWFCLYFLYNIGVIKETYQNIITNLID